MPRPPSAADLRAQRVSGSTTPALAPAPTAAGRLWGRVGGSLLGGALVSGALLFGFWSRQPASGLGQAPDRPRALLDFQLTDSSGRVVSNRDLAGKFCVVNFVFTSCSVSCLQVSRHMAQIQRLLADDDDVRLVSLSVDPRTDTPPVLARFAARLEADTNRWWFLTGDKDVLYPLIEASFLPRDASGGYQPMPGGFLHADRIALVDRQGRVRAYFEGMRPGTPAAVLAALSRLRAGETP